jgi:fructan beta-fructosidase
MSTLSLRTICLLFGTLCFGGLSGHAASLKVAGIFGDRMVLQREKPIPIWGAAAAYSEVSAEVNGQRVVTKAGPDGRWKLVLEPMKAWSTPVPFKISSGSENVVFADVVIGEVWFAAGQSNMTMPVREAQNAASEIAAASDSLIREFTVAQRLPYAEPRETTDRTGSWIAASPQKVGEFSATGYFFARALREKLNVPVGIIHASAGGIAAETLTPPDAIAGISELKYLLDERGIGYGRDISEDEWNRRKQKQAEFWLQMEAPETDDSSWERVDTLVTDNKTRFATWFRYRFTADEAWSQRKVVLRILKVAGMGRVSLNGKRLSSAGGAGIDALEYKLAPGDLRAGENVLAFRINGYALNRIPAGACSLVDAEDRSVTFSLPATALRKAESDDVVPRDNLALLGNLFNGMVAPIIPYQVRGIIWYQGESNVSKAGEYRKLFPALIAGWRKLWGEPELPFCFVQLAGFMNAPSQPAEKNEWAALREAQASALTVPGTAMAVALDLGDVKLIHPVNKQEVGRRLALAALSKAYGDKEVVGSGPVYASHSVSGGAMRIVFSETAGGLAARDGAALKGFAVAGESGPFVWAEARVIDGKIVEVSSPQVPKPARVLYGWGQNSDANLVNSAGLPAVPFRAAPAPAPEPPPQALYQETLRPRFHITARQWDGRRLNPGRGTDGWLNDLNGLVYHAGEYHVFAQRWATAWLHWVSSDLVHWTEMRPAFTEERKYDGVQSGSAVIDKANTAGLATDPKSAPMVAFYSSGPRKHPDGSFHATQCMAYSNDLGRTWTKYDENPVLADAERDPKVFWYEPEKKWVMVLFGPPGGFLFYSSKNLKDWEKMSFIPGFFECPDMFALPLDGDKAKMKWVLVNGDGSYVVGDFDGTTFHPATERRPSCAGPDFYATQTFNNAEEADGRVIQLAWLRRGWYPNEVNYFPDMPFNQQMTFPCELTLKSYHGGMRIFRTPIKDVEKLHRSEQTWNDAALAAGDELKLGTGDAFHVKADLEMSDGSAGEILFRGETLQIANGKISVRGRNVSFVLPKDASGKNAPVALEKLDLLLDRTSIEAFANEGEVSLSAAFVPSSDEFVLKCTKGQIRIRSMKVFAMGSIWKEAS